MNKNIIYIIVGSIFVIGVLISILSLSPYKTEEVSPTPRYRLETPKIEIEKEGLGLSVSASSQEAGNSVSVDFVEINTNGYVVIHEESGGKPGKVIGRSELLEPGKYSFLVIDLERESNPGETLYAMLHQDDGDKTYEFPGDDAPLKDEQGNIVVSSFNILGEIQEEATTEPVQEPTQEPTEDKQQQTQKEPQPQAEQPQEVSIVSGNFFFSPNNLSLKKGKKVKLVFQNSGVHTFTIDELGVDFSLSSAQEVYEFTPQKSGNFRYYCRIPGHLEAGMLGDLVVSE